MNKLARIILDCSKGQIPTAYASMDKDAREDAVRQELLNIMGLEKFEKRAFRKAIRKPEVKVATFEIIEEIVNENFKTDSNTLSRFAQLFCDIRNLALGDENLFYVEGKHSLVVSEYSGSHMTVRKQRFQSGQSFSLEMRNFIIGVFVYVEQLLAGRQDLATFVMALNEAVAKKVDAMIVTAFEAGLTNIPTAYKVNGSYNEANILAMLEKLEAVNGQVKPRLVGTSSGLRKLQGIENLATAGRLSEKMKDQLNEQFFMPVWNGYECVELANTIKEGTIDELVLDSNKIYAVCGDQKICQVVFEGDSMVKENSGDEFYNADMTIDYTLAYKANASVAYSGVVGQIELK